MIGGWATFSAVTAAISGIAYQYAPRLPLWQITSLSINSAWLSFPSYSHEYWPTAQVTASAGILMTTSLGLPLEMYDITVHLGYPNKATNSMHWLGDMDLGTVDPRLTAQANNQTFKGDDGHLVSANKFSITSVEKRPIVLKPSSQYVITGNLLHISGLPIDLIVRHMLRDIWNKNFHVNIVSAAFGHFKVSGSPAPVTVGFTCEHSLAVLKWPAEITDRECEIDSVSPGWQNITKKVESLKRKRAREFFKRGKIFF